MAGHGPPAHSGRVAASFREMSNIIGRIVSAPKTLGYEDLLTGYMRISFAVYQLFGGGGSRETTRYFRHALAKHGPGNLFKQMLLELMLSA